MAARFWIGGGTNANWNASPTTNWSATSGGVVRVAAPTSSDDVTFDGNGNSNSTISATITVLSLTITSGYTSTMTHNAVLTIVGNWNYSNTYTISGSSAITISSASTITSNSKTWPNGLILSGTTTTTISGNLTISGSLSITGRNPTINATSSEKIICGGLSHTNANSSSVGGTIKIEITTGTWSGTRIFALSEIIFNGNLTISGVVQFNGTLTYTSGVITTTGSQLLITTTSTINTNGVVFDLISFSASGNYTITLLSNLSCASVSGITNIFTISGAYIIYVSSSLSITSGILSGNATVEMTGGIWSGGGTIGVNITFNGNVTVSGSVVKSGGTILYTSGTITTTSSTLNINTCTLNTSGITWNNVTLSDTTAQTYTINSTLSASLLTIGTGTTTTFAGTAGFSVATLSSTSTGAITVNFKESITYTITTSLECFQSRNGSILLFTSSHATTKAIITLQYGATCKCVANFTRIDSGNGRPIRSFNGTITDCSNVVSITDLRTVSAAA